MPGVAAEVLGRHLVVAAARRGRRGRSAGRTRPPSSITRATARPIFHDQAYVDAPATASMMKISSGAYATEDSASLAKTGKRDPLGQQRLTQLRAAQLAPEQDPLGDVADTHERQG